MDELLCQHLAADFRDRYEVDALAKPRSARRLRQASERVRRVLSANAEGTIALDCLVGDTDVHGSMTRVQLEALSQPLIAKAVKACVGALAEAGLEPSALDAVELVGGYSRTPAFIAAVREAFGIEPSRTLNAEESVARGAALDAGMHSRSLRMRPFRLQEGLLHPTSIHWERNGGGSPTGFHELPRASQLPLQKRVTLRTRSPMRISCRCDDSNGIHRELSCLVALNESDASCEGRRELRVDVTIDDNQVPSINAFEVIMPSTAAQAEAQISETAAYDAEQGGATDNTTDNTTLTLSAADNKTDAASAAPAVYPIDAAELSRFGLSGEALRSAVALELEMQQHDQTIEDALTAKNELEAEIYRSRARLDDQLADFVTDDQRQGLLQRLESLEDWLYDAGEHQSAARYDQEREQLRTSLSPTESLALAHTAVAAELVALDAECSRLRHVHAGDTAAAAAILAAVDEAEKWSVSTQEKLSTLPRHSAPAVPSEEVLARLRDLRTTVIENERLQNEQRSSARSSSGMPADAHVPEQISEEECFDDEGDTLTTSPVDAPTGHTTDDEVTSEPEVGQPR